MQLRTLFMTLVLTMLVFAGTTYVACNKDACKNVVCQNGGGCLDGQCMCPEGYTGKNCETKKDLCAGIVCQNGGTCENGVCKCPPGYEGIYCETKTDSCMYVVCLNGATCTNGKCYCPKGYEGKNCEVLSKNKFKGVWTVFENGTISTPAQYSVSINDGTVVYNMLISNFYNKINTPMDVAINRDSIFIPQQILGGHEMQGWGVMNAQHNQITFYYSIKDLSNGTTDDFGLVSGEPSIWTK